jgi:hypothetical protein
MTILLKITSLKSNEMGKQLMHMFMVLDKKKLAQGASALLNFNKIPPLETAILKKIQISCDVTCQVVNSTNISGEHSSSIFLLTHLYIHHFSMVGSNFSLHTKDSMFGENISL